MRRLLVFILFATSAFAGPPDRFTLNVPWDYILVGANPQTHIFPGLDTNNIFTGSNTFITANGCQHVNANQSFATALTAAGSLGCLIVDPGTYTVSTNTTVPIGVTTYVMSGGQLSISTGVTLTLASIVAGPTNIFVLNGTGVVNFAKGAVTELYPLWWGGAGDGTSSGSGTDNTPAFNAAVASACNSASAMLRYPTGAFTFNSKPNNIGCGVIIKGEGNGANVSGGTALMANYTEATATNGFITYDGSFGTALGTGGGLENLQLFKAGSNTVGAALALISADDNHRPGWFHATHVQIWCNATATWSYALYVDGHNNSTSGTQGIRDGFFHDDRFSCATVTDGNIWLNNATHFLFDASLVDGNGTPGVTVTGTGGAAPSTLDATDVTFSNVSLFGDLVIDQASNVVSRANVEGTGNVNITSNAAQSWVEGPVAGGTITNSSTTSIIIAQDPTTKASMAISGGVLGARATGLAVPTGTSGRLFTREGTTSGTLVFGDATCFFNMSAALTMNFNCGNGAIFNFAGSAGTALASTTPGAVDVGTTAKPFGNLWLGTAATNNFKFQPAATAASRVITIADPLGATNLVLTPAALTVRSALHTSDQGTACTNGELALSAGFGTTATVTAVAGISQTCHWTITSSGTGQAANPTITDTLVNALPVATIVCEMRMEGGTGTATLINQSTLSATAPVFTFNGTPVAASTYLVVRRCGP